MSTSTVLQRYHIGSVTTSSLRLNLQRVRIVESFWGSCASPRCLYAAFKRYIKQVYPKDRIKSQHWISKALASKIKKKRSLFTPSTETTLMHTERLKIKCDGLLGSGTHSSRRANGADLVAPDRLMRQMKGRLSVARQMLELLKFPVSSLVYNLIRLVFKTV